MSIDGLLAENDPRIIMAEHDHAAWLPEGSPCARCGQPAPCDAYQMAERLIAAEERARVAEEELGWVKSGGEYL